MTSLALRVVNNLHTLGATKCVACQEAQELVLLQRAVSCVEGFPVAGGLGCH